MPLRTLCRGACAPSPLGNVDNRLLPCGSDQDLRRFTFRPGGVPQHDLDLSEPRTEEASVGESWRPVINVAGWLPLSLVNRACCHKLPPSGGGS